MSRPSPSPEQPLRRQKIRDRAVVLPMLGLVLLMPPFAGIFQLDARIAGLPFTAVYLFFVWALLIGGAAALSRDLRLHLEAADEPQDPGAGASDDA